MGLRISGLGVRVLGPGLGELLQLGLHEDRGDLRIRIAQVAVVDLLAVVACAVLVLGEILRMGGKFHLVGMDNGGIGVAEAQVRRPA